MLTAEQRTSGPQQVQRWGLCVLGGWGGLRQKRRPCARLGVALLHTASYLRPSLLGSRTEKEGESRKSEDKPGTERSAALRGDLSPTLPFHSFGGSETWSLTPMPWVGDRAGTRA